MRPYETHPFPRSTNLIIINGPLLANFGSLRARFFSMYAFYALLFNFNFAKLYFARVLCFAFFSASLAAFSRASSSRAAVRSAVFLTLFFIISRAFPSRVIAYCSLLSAAVRCR
jgi:hypothetical protein